MLVSEPDHPFWEHWWPQGHVIGWEHTFVHELHHLLTAIREDSDVAPHGATLEDGYRAAEVCDAMLALGRAGHARDGELPLMSAHGPAHRDAGHEGRGVRLPARAPRLGGVDVLLADVGTLEPARGVEPDIAREEVARGDGRGRRPRWRRRATAGAAIGAMAEAAAALARRLHGEGRIHGVLAAGGSGNTAIATRAMQALPVGVPKLMVSTVAAGNTGRLHGRLGRDADGLRHRRGRDQHRSRPASWPTPRRRWRAW